MSKKVMTNFVWFGFHRYKVRGMREKVKRAKGRMVALRLKPWGLTGLIIAAIRIIRKMNRKNNCQPINARKPRRLVAGFRVSERSLKAAKIAKGGTKTVKVLRSFCR
jgi:hypothetical protein